MARGPAKRRDRGSNVLEWGDRDDRRGDDVLTGGDGSGIPVSKLSPDEHRQVCNFNFAKILYAGSVCLALIAGMGIAPHQSAFSQTSTEVNWPDQRPIGFWMVASGAHRSALNPRGYLGHRHGLSALDHQAFRAALLDEAGWVIVRMDAMEPKPQGIIIWDLEGQEFEHAFTYVGHPDRLAQLAPEMDAAADDFFALFRDAGYQVGLTIRPQTFGVGTALPPTCTPAPGDRFWASGTVGDKFVKTDEPFGWRGFYCTSTNVWRRADEVWPGDDFGGMLWDQTYLPNAEAVIDLLAAKIAYARSRWGVRMFYIDSPGYAEGHGGGIQAAVLEELQRRFPDVLLIPEYFWARWLGPDWWGVAAPYMSVQPGHEKWATPVFARDAHPGAFSVIDIANHVPPRGWVQWQDLVDGVRHGDILLFRAWFDAPEIAAVEDIYREAGVGGPPPDGGETPSPSPNLVANPRFEEQLTGWTNWGNSTTVTDHAVTGGRAARTGTGRGGVAQNVIGKLTVGASYRLQAQAKLGSSGEQFWIGVKFQNASGGVVLEPSARVKTTAYAPYTVDFTAPPGAIVAWVYTWKESGGSYGYADDVSLVEIGGGGTPPSPPPPDSGDVTPPQPGGHCPPGQRKKGRC